MLFIRFFPQSETATQHITTRVLSNLETFHFFCFWRSQKFGRWKSWVVIQLCSRLAPSPKPLHSPQRSDSGLHSSCSANVICLSSASYTLLPFFPLHLLSSRLRGQSNIKRRTPCWQTNIKKQTLSCNSKNTSTFVSDPRSGLDGKQPSREQIRHQVLWRGEP